MYDNDRKMSYMNDERGSLKKRLELRIDVETLEELELLAAHEDRTVGAIARRLIRAGLAAAQKEEAA